jgi:hypothetical protein
MKFLRIRRPSPAMVVAMLALLVALGGSAGADPVGEVSALIRGKSIAANAITSKHVKNRSLRSVDFARGQIPRGPAGPPGPAGSPGPAGAQGPPGPAGASAARYWAGVQSEGSVDRQSGGISARWEANNSSYRVTFPTDVSGCSYNVNGGDMASMSNVEFILPTDVVAARSSDGPRVVQVQVYDGDTFTVIQDDFFIAVHC